uniref:Uncharacterized protein n=1 Tax=Brassica campestris TaxID=3711 RepID=M4ES47_BRACM
MIRLEENEKLVLTPFEKNLDIWRQLWRVLERSDLASPWQSIATSNPCDTISLIHITNFKILPKPKPYERQLRPPHAAELLRAYCASLGYLASSGLPDETKAAWGILKDYLGDDEDEEESEEEVAMMKEKASHKQNKKPQRKKDRNWRVKNAEDGDGPLVRVFQKPADTGPHIMR